MDLRQLAAFVAVVEHGSFSAAARALHTVQSNVSTHVAHLERDLGVTLIDRARGGPTVEGQVVLERAWTIRHELEALEADVASLGAEVSGTVRLGAIGTTGRWLAPHLFAAIEAAHPGIRVVMTEATTTSLVPQVEQNQLDLAIVNLPIGPGDVTVEPLFDEDRILVAPDDHPLSSLGTVTLEELSRHELLLEPSGTGFRDALDTRAAEAGLELVARAEVDGMRLMTSLAYGGFGPAIVPASAVAPNVTGPWRQIPVADLPRRSVGLTQSRRGVLSAPAAIIGQMLLEIIDAAVPTEPGLHPRQEVAAAR